MKVIIFTASTGDGHKQAAISLNNEFISKNHETKIIELFESKKSISNLFMEQFHMFVVKKVPKLYSFLYSLSDTNLTRIFFEKLFYRTKKRLARQINNFDADIIVSTHPYTVPLVLYKQDKKIPFIQIVTDFKAHKTYINDKISAYIVASEYTKNTLINKGVNKDIVYTYGIPVKKEFYEIHNYDKNNILIMSGGLALDSIKEVVENILLLGTNFNLIIVCGKNENLKKYFEDKYKKEIFDKKMVVYGFTNKISELMDISKCIITKPGGSTITEAIYKQIPIIIPFYIEGQEKENLEFIINNNIGFDAKSEDYQTIWSKLEDDEIYLNIIKNMKNISKDYSVEKIVKLAEDLIKS